MLTAEDLPVKWRSDAEVLQRHGCGSEAEICLRHAEEVESELRDAAREELSIREAATLSGYSEEHLRRMARAGDLPATRIGNRGRIQIARADVPKKPGRSRPKGDASRSSDGYDVSEDARDIAKRMRR